MLYHWLLRSFSYYSHKTFWPWRAGYAKVDSRESPSSRCSDTSTIVHHNCNSRTWRLDQATGISD